MKQPNASRIPAPRNRVAHLMPSNERPRTPVVGGTTYLVSAGFVGEVVHVVQQLMGCTMQGGHIVKDANGRQHLITYDGLRRRWVGVPHA